MLHLLLECFAFRCLHEAWRHTEKRQRDLHEWSDSECKHEGSKSDGASEKYSDDHDNHFDARACQSHADSVTGVQPEHESVPWARAEFGSDVEAGSCSNAHHSRTHETKTYCYMVGSGEYILNNVLHESDLHRVQNCSKSGAKPEGNPQEQDEERDDDEDRSQPETRLFRNTLMEDIPRWNTDVGFNKESNSCSKKCEPKDTSRQPFNKTFPQWTIRGRDCRRNHGITPYRVRHRS